MIKPENDAALAFEKFFDTIRTLRGENGCPWDKKQTPHTLKTDLFEEVCEVISAIQEGNNQHVREELGDVLLCTVMMAYIFQQDGIFSVAETLEAVTEKLIRRHPHVFPQSESAEIFGNKADTPEKVLEQWEKIKQSVEGRRKKHLLDEVDKSLPPLLRAFKLQKKAAKQGFDWEDSHGPREKILEELQEVDSAAAQNTHLEEECGDLIFAVVNYCRKLGINPETALIAANEKFAHRFAYIEDTLEEKGKSLKDSNLEEMDKLWDEAKKKEAAKSQPLY
ncbi:MAG: nucleoside triphosphate pyrophosphohydrolase [Spirochaetaceae bacterium]|nr:nucleoside triphosphate pyrophosphohydrolase [Spirochaetaceae bacterium]